jgi:outer membrane protein assembly factor BamE (lipoprotein component of BamABCDE complex)
MDELAELVFHNTAHQFKKGKSMRSISMLGLLFVFTALSGCASAPNFVKPEPEKLTLGKSTSDDVLKLVGSPTAQSDTQLNNEKVHVVQYARHESPKFWGIVIKHRDLTYTFFNDVLVGDEFNSTFDDEATEFDTDKVSQIVKGKSTRADVFALLGKPAGELLYPIIADKSGSGVVYEYSAARFAGILTSTTSYLAVITFDNKNTVTNVSLKKNGIEQLKS